LLARAGHVREFRSLKTKLAKAKVEARAAFETIMRRDGKAGA
jgi:glutamate-ammonia-ligase adenylyltransferase